MGTIAAIPFYLLLVQTNPWIYWLFTLISLIFGVHICEYATKKLHVHDFGGIVWDEIVGYLITMGFFSFSWNSLVTGFLFFRLFDIFKPWPINWLDKKISGGLGIMLDDVLAGIFAAIALKFWF